jgi:hypothetical protein
MKKVDLVLQAIKGELGKLKTFIRKLLSEREEDFPSCGWTTFRGIARGEES